MIPLLPSSSLFPYTTLFRSDRATFGGKLQLERGEFAFEALDDRHGGIVEVADSEDDLESLIVLEAEAAEILVQLRSEEHTSELQSRQYLVYRLLLEKKKTKD